jgi:hypothetical protein
MKHIVSAPRSRTARRLLAGGALMGLLLAAGAVAIGDVSPEAKRDGARNSRQSLSLFTTPILTLRTNQIECGIDNRGNVCSNVFNSPTAAGGAWPVGSPNAYIYNTGLQIAGIMGEDAGPWANDTVGAYFMDARGYQPAAEGLTEIYNSLDPDDVANWPAEAVIPDEAGQEDLFGAVLFDTILIGRPSISQQDTWMEFWDGNPNEGLAYRAHPMGIKVTQRGLAWNYPSGNESVLYFILTFENVTNDPDFIDQSNIAFFGGSDALPAGGITLNEVYAAFSTDMDVSNAGENFSSAVFPFDLGFSYHGGFNAPEFTYAPDLFFPPFFTNAPGIVGIKYLRSPVDPETGEEVGLTLFSGTDNASTGFPDPLGDKQLWRYLSGNLNPAAGDFPCNTTAEVETGIPETTERSVCYQNQTAADTRFYQSSGPFSLAPGERSTIVVAYIIAPTVATMPDGSPSGIVAQANPNDNPPGIPSFHPGFPSTRGCDADGLNCTINNPDNPVRAIERGAGWVSYSGPPPTGRGNGALESPENRLPVFGQDGTQYISVVPGSLLGRALTAQSVFDNGFLLGFSPEQPDFFLVPGNNQVTITWNPSVSEELGDPFYSAATGDTASLLYNPNYRGDPNGDPPGDVEGYRVYRGTTPGNLQLIAQFDYANTTFVDVTCETIAPDEDPWDYSALENPTELVGYAGGEECPEDYYREQGIDGDLYFNNGPTLVPGGGVVRLADGRALATSGEAVGTDNWSGNPLTDSNIPWAYTDTDVTNNFTYFYAVSAFDINSRASGPYSLESARISDFTTPRQDLQNLSVAAVSGFIAGDDGVALNVNAPLPSLDASDGTFSGPMPPTNAWHDFGGSPFVPRLLGEFVTSATIDSFKPDPTGCDFVFTDQCATIFVGADGETIEVDVQTTPWGAFFANALDYDIPGPKLPYGEGALREFGIEDFDQEFVGSAVVTQDEGINFSNWEGQQNRRAATGTGPGNVLHGGARWFSGTEETTPDPTAYIRVGHLAEVDSVWAPIHHTATGPGEGALANSGSVQYIGYYMSYLGRAADFQVTWSGGGISVRDITHNVDVPFSGEYGSSWGFLNTDADGDGVISWWDRFCVGEMRIAFENDNTFGPGLCAETVYLEDTAQLGNIALNTAGDPTSGTTTTGFALWINAEVYFFATEALPADGTVWTLRAYSGAIATEQGDDTTDPSGYTYYTIFDETDHEVSPNTTGLRPGVIPGLQLNWASEEPTTVTASYDLDLVHTVPDPYLATSQLDRSPTSKQLQFVNLPPQATIRIYTLTGVLVQQIDHDDVTGGGRATWDIRNRNNQFAASGVYFYHVVTPAGDERVGKFTIVNFAGQN